MGTLLIYAHPKTPGHCPEILKQVELNLKKIGEKYELIAMEWFEISNAKIARRWGARDFASQARQLDMQIT